eukprot:Anaeramoba_ignava/a479968_11.p1 GENE.a479968_11~~a479968_11.p1  ORF type:complete len:223 (+),score=47.71 a479968_11:85-753(+)
MSKKEKKKGKRTIIIKQEVDDDNNVVKVDTILDQQLMDVEKHLKDIDVMVDFDFDFDRIDSMVKANISAGDSVLKEMHIYFDKIHKEMAPGFEKMAQMHQKHLKIYLNQVDSMVDENLKNIEVYIESMKDEGKQTLIIGEGKLNVEIDKKGEKLNIKYKKELDEEMELSVINEDDDIVFNKTIPKGSKIDEEIDVSGYKEGPYQVELKHNHLIILERIQVKH